ncbi:uncharacterized protein LOC102461505 isoform X2 [Pelodiscus sinensis]|uniref:uncharacterized protein LOC102461505 isoform X2 n=1 Tax=Pelodiscus sinensis TaxID=13735 RepID=UPI003F6B1B8C
MATTVTESQGVKLVTEVVSQTDSRAAQLASVVPQPTSAQVKGFRKAQPKALGLVSSGSVLVEAQRREGMWLVKVCCIISSIVIVATLMAVIIHGVEIGQAIPWCDTFKNDDGTVMRCSKSAYILSHGLNSMFILLCLLELCTAVTALVYGYKAMKQQDYTQMVL